jgi:2-keto-4-pentenoate hydratase/2-oxohepta-3-ene-1,7-dioic acid hydratase in catechol pathway
VRLVSLSHPEHGDAAAVVHAGAWLLLSEVGAALNLDLPSGLSELLDVGALPELEKCWYEALAADDGFAARLPRSGAPWRIAPLLRTPRKLLGVGLNYAEHAGDLGETRPNEPATFMKPATTIIGPGDSVVLPRQSERTTGEAELALVIGRRARDLSPTEALAAVAGVVPIIDMTAEDILQRNPRFLTRAKSFDSFFAFGPELVTLSEVGDLANLEVQTVLDGVPERRNSVSNMMFSPAELVVFFSEVMTLEPGDVISTGTPGAVVLRHGARIGCAIPGIGAFECPVTDRKVTGV